MAGVYGSESVRRAGVAADSARSAAIQRKRAQLEAELGPQPGGGKGRMKAEPAQRRKLEKRQEGFKAELAKQQSDLNDEVRALQREKRAKGY